MMTGWLLIIACSACSVFIAHLFKITEKKGLHTIHVLTVNYGESTVVSFLLSAFNGTLATSLEYFSTGMALLAVGLGFIFIVNFFTYSKSVHRNGVGISVAAMKISLLLPVLLSALWYSERLTAVQWSGVTLVFLTLFLLLPRESSDNNLNMPAVKWGLLPLLLFFLTGFGDSALKIFEEESSQHLQSSFFMGIVFLTSFLAGLACSIAGDRKPVQKIEMGMGLMIGIPNLLTPLFLIGALERMNGAVVYSSVSILTVIGGTVLGIMVWSDRLTTKQGLGLFLSLIAILLLI